MKKIVSISKLILFMSMISSESFAYDAKIDGIYYNFLNDNVAWVVCKEEKYVYNNGNGGFGHLEYKSDYTGDVVIPESVTYEGVTYKVTTICTHAFEWSTNLTSVIIPNSVTVIGEHAFTHCTALTSVTIPKSLYHIGENVFIGCEELKTIVSLIEEPLNVSIYRTFSEEDFKNIQLFVPEGSLESYRAAVPWSSFKNIVGIIGKVKLNKSKATLEKGKTLTLNATVTPETLEDNSVTWKSSDTKVATVTSDGKVTGVKTGSATITCTSVATGLSATCKVTVGKVSLNKSKASIEKGKTLTLTATVNPATLEDKSVTWKSSNTKVATVSSDGKVTGVKTGSAIITCTSVATGLSATCKVIIGKVSLDKSKAAIEKGNTLTLTATVYPTTLSDKSVTWESSDETVAVVTEDGIVTGVKAGTTIITCTSNKTGLNATCKVTVTASSGTRSLSGDDDETTGIDALGEGETKPYDVYDLSGRMVLHQVTSLDGLPNGVYIVNGRKVLKK